jgi:hypothetical protein
MRLLFLHRGTDMHTGSSLFNHPLTIFRFMLEHDPDLEILWTAPRGADKPELHDLVRAKLGENAARLRFLFVHSSLADRTEGYLLSPELVAALGREPFDVVLTNKPALREMLGRLLDVPVLTWGFWIATDEQYDAVPEYYAGPYDVLAEQLSGFHGTTIYESGALLLGSRATQAVWLRDDAIETLDRRVIPSGINTDALDRQLEGRPRSQDPIAFWGGRIANQKRPYDTGRVFQKLYEMGRVSKSVMTTPTPEHDPRVDKLRTTYRGVEVRGGVGQEVWFEMLAQGSISACFSQSEGYGAAWLEMLYAGIVVVYVRASWQYSLLPDGYPFVAEDDAQVLPMTLTVLDDLSAAQRYLREEVKPWIKQHHDQRTNALRFLEDLRAAVDEHALV